MDEKVVEQARDCEDTCADACDDACDCDAACDCTDACADACDCSCTDDCDCEDDDDEDGLKEYNEILIGRLLCQLTTSYKQLVDGADVMNKIGLAHRHDIEQAIDIADDLGHIIDDLLDSLSRSMKLYTNEVDRGLAFYRAGIMEKNRRKVKKAKRKRD